MDIHIESPKDRAQDPLITAALSEDNEPVTLHILRYDNHIYDVFSGDHSLKLLAHLQSLPKPKLIVYDSGTNAINQALAHCEFTETGLNDIGYAKSLGGKQNTLWWSDMDQNTPISSQYRFTAFVYFPSQASGTLSNASGPRHFIWKRTSRLILVDEETDTVAAIAHDITTVSTNCGTLHILVPFGDNFSLTVLTTFLTICEKATENTKR
ncbi:hypothetical protein PENANT_c308G07197 [Penicillium antarcticum]|uniref:Uncharacterized protein n=1 Tax=Penicillium antarcticum TaxID=416450 RepID=A0A1V6NUU3_9EURO|nr:hypothetical protein PENANT_c308G07197 [Penicillium antarcticum]